jgi:predicted metalloprotease
MPRGVPASRGGRLAGGGGGLAVVVALVVLAVNVLGGGGIDYDSPFQNFPRATPGTGATGVPGAPSADGETTRFLRFVVGDINDFWARQFARSGGSAYPRATVVVFSSTVSTGCGPATAATGPFYCPADSRVYLDLGFFGELARRFQAPGDFAQAYVVAHEIGHHIQNITGIESQMRQAGRQSPDQANELSVRLELQADCLAGVWGHSTYERGILEDGDLQEGLTAAAAVGDDRIQQQVQGRVTPETFTHGSAAQRTAWFRRGFENGDPAGCDTFTGDV